MSLDIFGRGVAVTHYPHGVAGEAAASVASGAIVGLALSLATILVLVHLVNPESSLVSGRVAVSRLRLQTFQSAYLRVMPDFASSGFRHDWDFPRNFLARRNLRHAQIEGRLEIQPALGISPKIASKPQCRIR